MGEEILSGFVLREQVNSEKNLYFIQKVLPRFGGECSRRLQFIFNEG